MEDAMQVIEAWEFRHRTNVVWVKDRRGMGYDTHQPLCIPRTPIFAKLEWFACPNGQAHHSWSLWGNEIPMPKVGSRFGYATKEPIYALPLSYLLVQQDFGKITSI
jgi:hypothetical protein